MKTRTCKKSIICHLAAAMLAFLLMTEGCERGVGEKQPRETARSAVDIVAPTGKDARWIIRSKTAEFHVLGGHSTKGSLLANGLPRGIGDASTLFAMF